MDAKKELKLIEQLAVTIPKNGKMLEVGSFVGRSSWCWARSVDPSVIVYCLDIWNPSEHPYHPPAIIGGQGSLGTDFGAAAELDHVVGTLENFRRNTDDCPNIRAIRGASPIDFGNWWKPLDLVFLDGVHHNPIFWEDLNFWSWQLKPGGILCGDDAARTHPDVARSIQDFAKNHDLTYFVIGQTWIIPRPPHRIVIAALFSNRT